MHLCVPFTINFYFWHEIVVLPNQQEVVKNNTICSSLQKKNALARKNAQNQRFHYINTAGMFLLQWLCFIFILWNIQFWAFFASKKMTFRPSRKQCSLLCVSVMKEYFLNFSYIRSKYVLLVFSSRFLLPKLKVFDIWKKKLSNFHEILESARARASFENWFCVESRVTAFTGKKN